MMLVKDFPGFRVETRLQETGLIFKRKMAATSDWEGASGVQ